MLIRTVPARQGAQWISDGWAMFRQRPGIWVALGAIDIAVTVLLRSGATDSALASAFTVIWAGGIAAAAESLRKQGAAHLSDAWAGIRARIGPLLVAALVACAITFICDLATSSASRSLMAIAGGSATAPLGPMPWLSALIAALVAVCGTMALWLAPPLIVLAGTPPLEALKASFVALWRNWAAGLVYGALVALLVTVALLTLGVGLFVVVPLIYLATYAACRDLFALIT